MKPIQTVRESLPRAVGVLCFAACVSLCGTLLFPPGAVGASGRPGPEAFTAELMAADRQADALRAFGAAAQGRLCRAQGQALSVSLPAMRLLQGGIADGPFALAARMAAFAAVLAALYALFLRMARLRRPARPAARPLLC